MRSPNGYEKAEEALRLIESLTGDKKRAAEEHAVKISETEGLMSDIDDIYGVKDVCHECEGMCCLPGVKDALNISDYVYVFLMITDGENRAKILDALKNNKGRKNCALVEEDSCMLPDNARPYICKAFHCRKVSDKIVQSPLFVNSLNSSFEGLKACIGESS